MLIIALGAFIGAILAALIGWLKSSEKFVLREFLYSVLTGIGSAIVFVLGYQPTDNPVQDILVAILGGMGLDYGTKAVVKTVGRRFLRNWPF